MTDAGPSASNGAQKEEYPGKLVSAASIAKPFQEDVANVISKRNAQGKTTPKLVGILATPSPPSVAYAEWTKKACEQVGIKFEIWKTWQDYQQDVKQSSNDMQGVEKEKLDTDLEADVEDLIIAANADDDIHGIMIYYPIFGGRQDTYLQQILDPRKDVEGLHFSYCWNMYHNVRWVLPKQIGGAPGTTTEVAIGPVQREDDIPAGFAKSILPCTPLAIVKCLEAMEVYDANLPYGDRLYGKVITVINRSEVVGRPLAALLSNDGAKVYSIDLDSIQEFNKRVSAENDRQPSAAVQKAREKNSQRRLQTHHIVRPCNLTMEQAIRASDVVISGVPSEKFKIDTDWVKEGAVTVNFSSAKNFEKDVRRRASKHLPAIGKTTIAMLQRNLLRLVQYREMSSNASAPSAGPDYGGQDGGSGASFGDGMGGPDGRSRTSTGLPSGTRPESGAGSFSRSMGAGGPQDSQINLDSEPSRRTGVEQSPLIRLNHYSNQFASRNRAVTMTYPHAEQRRERLPYTSHYSPGNRYQQARRGSVSTSLNPWEWRPQDRRGSVTSVASTACSPRLEAVRGHRHASISQQTPLLFAPINTTASSGHSSASSVSTVRPTAARNDSSYTSSSPYCGTPVSPLFFDGLSVEDIQPAANSSHRNSWDYNAPRTPREGQVIPSVFERPTRDIPQRHFKGYYSPMEEKSASLHPAMSPAQDLRQVTVIGPTSDRLSQSRPRRRQRFSYSSLIAQAISSSPEGRMTLREIYTWISNYCPEMYPMEDKKGEGWQNTVRHNLSLNKSFVKVARTAQDIYESCTSGDASMSQAARGKGGWWTLDHSVMSQAQLKGEIDMGEYGNEFIEEQDSNGEVQRAQRRRRTDSFALSVTSEDAQSPRVDYFTVPSVLQPPPTPQERSKDLVITDGTVPSVFMQPRPRTADRSMTIINGFPPSLQEIQMAGRSRGYTMGDAEASYHRHNLALTNSPSKRKLPFASDYSYQSSLRHSRMDEVPRPATAAAAPASTQHQFVRVPPSPSPFQHSSLHPDTKRASPPSKLSLLRRVDGQSTASTIPASPKVSTGRMSITGMLNA
jgi:methylenetetrahydrofolate dehydrogenase (NAD+)